MQRDIIIIVLRAKKITNTQILREIYDENS